MATNKPRRKTYSDEFKEFLVQEAISSGRSIGKPPTIPSTALLDEAT